MVLALSVLLYSYEQKTGNTALAFDEMLNAGADPRPPYRSYHEWYAAQDPANLIAKSRDAENIFRKTGITFNVYGHEDQSEKLIPFDIIPRIISAREWRKLAQASNSASSRSTPFSTTSTTSRRSSRPAASPAR